MNATVNWVKDAMFLAESGSGHTVVMDGPPEYGGANLAARPMEMILMGLGGCAIFDVVKMLKKGRQDIRDCRVELVAERAQGVPSPFTQIEMVFIATGVKLKDAQVKRAVELSAEKYCSASIMLEAAGVVLTHSYKVINVE